MFTDIVNRARSTDHWQKIPWDDPDFSRRMLAEHLSQAHDAASRRTAIIDQHVAWIHDVVLAGQPSALLDLGCGPGLYTARLAALGHACTGIDFSPASVAYAREHAPGDYVQADLRQAAFGTGYDLVMLLFGELNAFAPDEAAQIVAKAWAALKPGGRLLLEPHTEHGALDMGREPPSWFSAQSGLFSDTPHLCLVETFLEGADAARRYYLIDAETGRTTTYVTMLHAYTEQGYRDLLRDFADVTIYPSLGPVDNGGVLCAIVARKG